jgi:hypothetical protein
MDSNALLLEYYSNWKIWTEEVFVKPIHLKMKNKAFQKLMELIFNPCVKFVEHEGLLFPVDDESKAILRVYAKCSFIPAGEYDNLLRFVGRYGLSIEVSSL